MNIVNTSCEESSKWKKIAGKIMKTDRKHEWENTKKKNKIIMKNKMLVKLKCLKSNEIILYIIIKNKKKTI